MSIWGNILFALCHDVKAGLSHVARHPVTAGLAMAGATALAMNTFVLAPNPGLRDYFGAAGVSGLAGLEAGFFQSWLRAQRTFWKDGK